MNIFDFVFLVIFYINLFCFSATYIVDQWDGVPIGIVFIISGQYQRIVGRAYEYTTNITKCNSNIWKFKMSRRQFEVAVGSEKYDSVGTTK